MADTSFTFLEVHLGDGQIQIGPRSIGGNGSDTDDTSEDGPSENGGSVSSGTTSSWCPCPFCSRGCDCRACRGCKALAVLALLGVIAVVVWKLLGGESLPAAEELDDLVEDSIELDEED